MCFQRDCHFYPIVPSDNQQADLWTHLSPIINSPLILPAGFAKPSLLIALRSLRRIHLCEICIVLGNPGSRLKMSVCFATLSSTRQSVTKPPVTKLRSEASGLTKDWPRASVLLFVSNTLTRAVKLSNSLPLPSSVNNGTLHLAVLSDINKHGHKGIPDTCEGCQAPTCSQTKRETNKQREKKEACESWRTRTQAWTHNADACETHIIQHERFLVLNPVF